ncbi:chloride channel protein [Novosphingobium sp. M1R2S20]|uniref:Chloride channel protein n=1 Tax=Novosphingobium rhizovicinum TaxID=3228928 RepID=A0ABV3R9Z4_9SPHN
MMPVAQRRIATAVGAVLLGLVALSFAWLGDRAQAVLISIAHRWPYAPLVLTPCIFAAAAWVTHRWFTAARGSGIPQVIAAAREPAASGDGPLVSLRTALGKFGLTLVMLLAGGSVGREGPTVQISAAIMIAVHRWLRVPITAGVYIAGGAAGVSAAFNTPLAGVAFAIEELASAYEQQVAVLVMAAVMIAGFISLGLAGDYVYFGLMRETLNLRAALIVIPVVGVCGGIAGGLFSRAVLRFGKVRHPWIVAARQRPVLLALGCGMVVAALGVATQSTWGTGYEATRAMVEGDQAPLWFGPAKLASTLATTLSGTPGGIFAPSLSVGAGIGNLLSPLFDAPAGVIVVLGMVSYFVGVVRAPLTAVIIIMETTASRGLVIPLFAAALIADAVSALVCRERLYHGLSAAFLSPAAKA